MSQHRMGSAAGAQRPWGQALLGAAILAASALGACSARRAGNPPDSPSATATSVPLDGSPEPTASRSPTSTITPSSTRTPTPTPTPHPLSIAWLRGQTLPGSEVIIEEILEDGRNYHRYLASYRSEGLKIYALLTVPFGEPPESGWPVIIFNHGYIPPDQYQTTQRYVNYVDGFARNGYIVFRSDYRGHGQSEGVARGGYGSPDYTIDVLNAVASMKRYPEADPERIGMWGHSMGGFITLRSMVSSADIQAGVIWAGVVASYPDLLDRWSRSTASGNRTPTPSSRGWRSTLVERYGSPEENAEFWNSLSANSYLGDLSGPVQLHHGTADNSVPFEFSATLFDQILAAGGTVEFYEYPGDNHDLANYFTMAMQRSIGFFDTYVKGTIDR